MERQLWFTKGCGRLVKPPRTSSPAKGPEPGQRRPVKPSPTKKAAISATSAGIALPGEIYVENHRLFVACTENTWLELVEVQLEGKKRLAAAEFLRGNPLAAGARLGTATE